MANWISSSDKDCRYLREDPGRSGQFSRFVQQLGVTLPEGVTIADAVRFGWVTPALRVRLPDEFFLEWENYPKRPRKGVLRPEFEWAEELHDAAIIFCPGVQLHQNDDAERWFVHSFDRLDTAEARHIREHAISAEPNCEPQPVHHPNGTVIAPYIDFFAYWQAYRLAESIAAAIMFKPILNTPAAAETIRQLEADLPRWQEFSQDRIVTIRGEYEERAPTFDWLSRYRTLRGAAVDAIGRLHSLRRQRKRSSQSWDSRLKT